jgi:hypothetical protein
MKKYIVIAAIIAGAYFVFKLYKKNKELLAKVGVFEMKDMQG